MKKKTIWTIAIIMGMSFLALLFLQLEYIKEMARMKKEQFDESVKSSLSQASRNLELNETLRYLEKDINDHNKKSKNKNKKDSVMVAVNVDDGTSQQAHHFAQTSKSGGAYSSFEMKTSQLNPSNASKAIILFSDKNSLSQASKSMQEIVRNRYVYQKSLLDQIIMTILYSASEKPLKERVNFKQLDQDLKAELYSRGIKLPYHFTVHSQDGREVYRCPDYDEKGEDNFYEQELFPNDPGNQAGVIHIHFPDMDSYIYSSVKFIIPSIVFLVVLLVTFIFTIFVIFRQKKLSEIKNDFINNMTHELKTPISSISLAAQMLNDDSLSKSPSMLKHVSGVIADESKRLRFLVEKVLQMSMFEKQNAVFKKKELDLNEMLENAAHSFQLRVEHTGGKIDVDIEAIDSAIYVDEVHFTNMIFNLMDNAIKYRKPDHPLNIMLHTWNEKDRLFFSIEDDGVGIKKDNLKKIFEKFYRVHMGNVHDVKGFGLGLAYVKKIVDLHGGEIRVESEYGKGTKFIVSLPAITEE